MAEWCTRSSQAVFLIDGYNLLFARSRGRIDSRDLDQERERLVRLVQRYCHICGKRASIIFDHTKGPPIYGHPTRRVLDEVEVRFTTEDVSADDEIISTVESTNDRTAYTVISSDRQIVDRVRKLKMKVLDSTAFADELAETIRGADTKGTKNPLAKEEVDYWMKEFGVGE